LAVLTGCGSNQPSVSRTQPGAVHAAQAAVPPKATHAQPDPNSSAGDCTGTIGALTVTELQVPPGATCRLRSTTVTGNVSIGPGAALTAHRVAVDGDVEGQGAHRVVVSAGSSIGGNLHLDQGGSATVSRSEVHGDLQWTMQAGPLSIRQTDVTGNLQVDQNRGRLTISDSHIGGDLQCQQNTRTPTQRANTVGGHREGQCAPVHRRRVPTTTHRHAGPPPAPPGVHRAKRRPPCAGDSVSDDPSDDQCGDN
jgi:hypothetical protein